MLPLMLIDSRFSGRARNPSTSNSNLIGFASRHPSYRLLAARLVDELIVIVGRALDGGADSRTIVEAGDTSLKGRIKISLQSCESLAHGAVRLRYAVTPDEGTLCF